MVLSVFVVNAEFAGGFFRDDDPENDVGPDRESAEKYQEQGDQALERLDDMVEYHEENGYGTGMMNGAGNCQGTMQNAEHGRGMMGRHY